MKLTCLLLALVACSDPPADPSPDAPPEPSHDTIAVRPDGVDANDGVAAPVKTLRRAIELAYGDGRVKVITLAPGRYNAPNGEQYPYTVPARVTIRGVGANVVLVGPDDGTGLVLDTGGLEDLDLEGFDLAIDATGASKLTGVRVRAREIGVRVGAGANVQATRLAITGAEGGCGTGVVLAGTGALAATELSTARLAVHVELRDQSSAQIARSHLDGIESLLCSSTGIAHRGRKLELADSQIDWMSTGIAVALRPETTAIANTTIDRCTTGIDAPMSDFTMSGGTISHSSIGIRAGSSATGIAGATITDNSVGIEYQQRVLVNALRLTVTGSTVRRNGVGISLAGPAVLQPSNTIAENLTYGISAQGPSGTLIESAGTTWSAGVQGADSDGHYAAAVVAGPVDGGNFALGAGWTLQL